MRVDAAPALVSVLVPTFMRPRLLPGALDSIARQTFTSFEVLVLNDGGASVERIVTGLGDPRFSLVEFPRNRGKAAVLNEGLRRAAGHYVAYLDDDDEYLPHHLEVLLEALRGAPEHRWAYADTLVRYHKAHDRSRAAVFTEIENESDVNFPMLYAGNRINHKNALHERRLALEVGGYDETGTFLIDWEIFLKMAAVAEPLHVRQVTSVYYRPLFSTTNKTFEAHKDAGASARREAQVRRSCAVRTHGDQRLVSLLVGPGTDADAIVTTVTAAVETCGHDEVEVLLPSFILRESLERRLGDMGVPCSHVPTDGQTTCCAMNAMAVRARGDVLAFVRPGHRLLPGWLPSALGALRRPGVGLVGSLDLDSSGSWTVRAGIAAGRDGQPTSVAAGWPSLDRRLRDDVQVPAVAAWTTCVTRDHFRELGGFDSRVPELVAAVDLSMRSADRGLTHYCAVRTIACELEPGATAYPTLGAAALRPYAAHWEGRGPWRPAGLPGPEVPEVPPPDWSVSPRPYTVVDPRALWRDVAGARKLLLVGTSRATHVEAIARALRAGAPGVELGLLAQQRVATGLAHTGLFDQVFSFASHRLHLSLVPEALCASIHREGYKASVVTLNRLSLVDYGHVFAFLRLAGVRPRFAVTPAFDILKLHDTRLRAMRGAWYGRSSTRRHREPAPAR